MSKPTRFMTRLSAWLLCVGLILYLSGCTVPPPTPGATPTPSGTKTGTQTTGTTGSPGTTAATPTPMTVNSIFGLGGETSSAVTKQDIYNNYRITMVDGTSTVSSSGAYTIAAGTWEASELGRVNRVLSTLPESFRRHTQTLVKTNIISSNPPPENGIYGGLYDPTLRKVYISDQPSDLEGCLVHEMTHA